MWWRRMVHFRDDVIGLDSSIVTTPSVHQASGHVDNFSDPMVDCTESKKRFRADQLLWAKVELEDGTVVGYVSMVEDGDVEKALAKAAKKLVKEKGAEGPVKELQIKDMTEATEEEVKSIPSPATGTPGSLTGARAFNLMFETYVGPYSDGASKSYLRPETAQGIFVNFKQVAYVMRQKIPFGIAQIGKAFRNEITPRQFLFRSREFEQMEIEYFIDPEVDVREECLRAASITDSRETTTWQKMIDTLQSWMQKASQYVCTFGSTVLDLVKYLVLSLGIILEVFRVTLEDIIRKCRDSVKVKNSSELGKRGASIITEAAADSSAADEIEVQGEGLPSDGFAHRDGCNSLEQSSGAAEECDDIEVQGEGLPIDGVTHQYGCNSLEQSSGAAEECDEIEVQGEGAASDSERQRRLDEQIVLSFINPAGRLPLATVWLMFPWSFGLWGQMKGSTTTSPVFRASMVTRGLMYKLCKPKCQQSSAQLVLNRQSQCDQWIQLLWSPGGGKTMPSTSMVWPLLKRFQCKTLV
eukprot:symbB.v1.2.010380.t3/scaffold678.1/size173209/8